MLMTWGSKTEIDLDAVGELVGSSEFPDADSEDVAAVAAKAILDRKVDVSPKVSLHFDSGVGTIRALIVPGYCRVDKLQGLEVAIYLNEVEITWAASLVLGLRL